MKYWNYFDATAACGITNAIYVVTQCISMVDSVGDDGNDGVFYSDGNYKVDDFDDADGDDDYDEI